MPDLDAALESAATTGDEAPAGTDTAEQAGAAGDSSPAEGLTPDEWESLKSEAAAAGSSPENYRRAMGLAHHLTTPEGQEAVFMELAQQGLGKQFFDARMTKLLSTSEGRRNLTRALARVGGNRQSESEGGEYVEHQGEAASGGNEALLERLEQLEERLAATDGKSNQALGIATSTTTAIERDTVFSSFAQKNPDIRPVYGDMVSQANALIRENPREYAGPAGAQRALQTAWTRFETVAKRAGFARARKAAPTLPAQASGSVAVKPLALDDLSPRDSAKKLVEWMRETGSLKG